ncbi:Lrp/AsnC family transcriptional regulator [Actinospica sp. MGRD01-02]|uniref:Lrp/AsnC family transcriptional regulator n=1 Tax=Actinospica acidithermotolerans TaxID=2828514 RepID=A0A941EGU7_9ACTN|nr:Lrp/AsnC family transcriptional regulator [Actinospica acidithermotolerans]MBR7828819.1 Lrp/AsnC family transcriptional regulator [Actinospica acidithermotolerans]
MRQTLDETDRRIAAALLASPRASWREVAASLELSERTVVRRAAPLYADGTLRATAVLNPAHVPDVIPLALRIDCRPTKIQQVARALARRPDTTWVDVLGSGDEISAIFFLEGAEARNNLLLRDLPATDAVRSWSAYTLLRVFPSSFRWTAGLLTAEETARLMPPPPAGAPAPLPIDEPLITALTEDGRATYTDLGRRAGITPLTARRRLEAIVRGQVVRLATEVDLALLGIHAEALLWITVQPGALEETAQILSGHPQVRFTAATTGSANLLIAVAAADLNALYAFLTATIGPLSQVTGVEITPLLATAKRTGLIRRA